MFSSAGIRGSTDELDFVMHNFINQNANSQLPLLTGSEDGEVPRVMGYNTKLMQDASTVNPFDLSGYGVTKFLTPGQRSVDSLQSTFSFGNINHQNISSFFNLSKQKTPTPTAASNSRLLQGSAELPWMTQFNAINHQAIPSNFQTPTTSPQGITTPPNPYSYIISPVDQPPMIVTNYGIYVNPNSEPAQLDVQKQNNSTLTTIPGTTESARSASQSGTPLCVRPNSLTSTPYE
ncbi:hypothetical protein FO519_010546, partial [Halicephalobus sp. NKZ332]